jgi:molybdopterin converting factor small subunit
VSSSPTITITVRYFAILRDLLGKGEERLTVPTGTTWVPYIPW